MAAVHPTPRQSAPSVTTGRSSPTFLGLVACGVLAWSSGCSSESAGKASSGLQPDAGATEHGGTSTSSSPTSAAASGATTTSDDVILSVPVPTSSGAAPNGGECQRDTYEAERTELNLLLLLDLSGSMLAQVNVDTGETQWEAVRQAIREFVSSPSADGLGISITYYPILSARTACEPGTACADGYACIANLCAIPTLLGFPYPCVTDRDCFGEVTFEDGSTLVDRCLPPYSCIDYDLQLCFVDENCPNGDTCDEEAGEVGICPGTMSCSADDYSVAKVPLQVLPAGRDALLASLDESYVDFYSATPTQVALEGAVRQVREWQTNEPDKRSVVVLATDGMPEGCQTTDDEDLLQATLQIIQQAASEDLSTFVIGVMPMADETSAELTEQLALQRASLDAMAQAGGTMTPFVVQADTSTTQAFLQALDEVRSVALACDYTLPEGTADFSLVNVETSTGGEPQTIPKVDAPTDCVNGGWFYDSDETPDSDVPTRVVLCPTTCDLVQADAATRVDVVLGCPTIRQVL